MTRLTLAPSRPALARPGDTSDGRLEAFRSSDLFALMCQTVWARVSPDDQQGPVLCGLAMALAPGLTKSQFVDALPVLEGPIDFVAIVNTMAHLGFKSSIIRTNFKNLDVRLLPGLVRFGSDDEISLIVASDRSEHVQTAQKLDPVSGEFETVLLERVEWNSTREFVVFQKSDPDAETTWKTARETSGAGWFRYTLRRFHSTLRTIILLGFALNLVALCAPLYIMLVYDRVVGSFSTEALRYLVVGAGLLLLAEFGLRYVRSLTLAWFTSRLDFIVGTALFDKLLSLPPRLIERDNTSSQLARIKTFESVRDFFSGPVLISALELPSVILSFAVIVLLAGPLALVCVVAAIGYLILFALIWRKLRVAMQIAAIESSRLHQFNLETFSKLTQLRSDGLVDVWAEKHRDLCGRAQMSQYRLFVLGQLGDIAGTSISACATLGTLWFGAHLIWLDGMSAAALIAVVILTWRVIAPFHSLCSLISRFEQTRNSIKQIDKFMEAEINFEQGGNLGKTPDIKGSVDFVSVSLRYEKAAGPLFIGLNAQIKPGEIVAITGPNGAGKSSVLKLVAGLTQPLLGSVRLDGFDVRQIDGGRLRHSVAYVPQDIALFSGTIAENLRLAAPLASDAQIWSALDTVGAAEQVKNLPEGLATSIGRDQATVLGDLLVQRLGLARGLLKKSALLLIDEPSSSSLRLGLDQNIKSFLQEARGSRTVLFVTHRIDLLRLADKVIVLRPGLQPLVASPDRVLELEHE